VQIDSGQVSFTGIRERPGESVDRSDRALSDRRAKELGAAELRLADDMAHRKLAVHVISKA
jgi:hypothetical protein